MDDATLVHRAAAGDSNAFAAIYDTYAGRIHDFLWFSLGDARLATELLVDTFLSAGARIHQLGDPDRLRPWLFGIARYLGSQAADDDAGSTPPTGRGGLVDLGNAGQADLGALHELSRLLRATREALSFQQRAVLDLSVRHDLAGSDLADALGTDTNDAQAAAAAVRDEVEDLLGLAIMAMRGRHECPALAVLLITWNGVLTPAWSERIAQHAASCEVCDDIRSTRLGAAAFLAAAPAVGLAHEVRGTVIDDVDLASHRGRPWPGPPPGFPPPAEAGSDPRWRWPAVAAAAAVLVLLGIVALLSGDRGTSEQVAAGPQGSTTSLPPSSSSSTSVASSVATIEGAGSTTPTLRPIGSSPTAGGTTAPRGTSAPTTPATQATTKPTQPPPTAASTTTTPADTTGPTVVILGVSPGAVLANPSCTTGEPAQATVTAQASDPSGISSVNVRVAPGLLSPIPMIAAGGGTYSAIIGPMNGPSVSLPAEVIVFAVDGAGNERAATASIDLRCNPLA